MAKYTLVGVNGNAFSVMGYTSRALKNEGLGNLTEEMREKATSGDYQHLLSVCVNYVEKANEAAYENGYKDEDEDDDW